MDFLHITLLDFIACTCLLLVIVISTLLLYMYFEQPSYPVAIIVSKPSKPSKLSKPCKLTIKKSPIRNTKVQPLPSFHPKHVSDEIKETGLIQFLRKKHLKHGWIVSDLPLRDTISVIDPISIKSSLYLGDRPKNMYQFLEPICGKDNFQVFSAERANTYRNFFGPALDVDVIIDKFDDIRNFGVEMIDRWEKSIVLKSENVIRMQDQSLEFSLKATVKVLFGEDLPQNLDLRSYRKAYDDVIGGLFDKQFGAMSVSRDERIQNSLKLLLKVLCNLIDEKKKNTHIIEDDVDSILPSRKDLLNLLISNKDPETGKKFEDKKIRSIMSMFLTSGYLTTGVAISWTIFCITQDREVQAKIQNEVDYVLKGRLPLYHDLLNLDYLTQVVKESLRMYPPVPFLSRYLAKDMNLETTDDTLNLTAGTIILYPITSFHEDKNILCDSEYFDPSRFSSNQLKTSYSHCPFGFGKRICPAEQLAMIEIKLMVCLIMQRFYVELAMPLNKVSKDEKFVLMARNDIYIKLVPRKGID